MIGGSRRDRRRRAREGATRRAAWLRAVDASDLPEDTKKLARVLAEAADDDGTVIFREDVAGNLYAAPGRSS